MADKTKTYRYLFGPVVSRRYGLSLGVDMVVPKTCSFNCLFCQIGETASTTVQPGKLPAVEDIIDELSHWIGGDGKCGVITLAGSGEPTLHGEFGRVLDFVKARARHPTLLLSNGSLFFLESVREQAMSADIVKLSLHAWDQSSFERVTRADSALEFDRIIAGYRKFRDKFRGRIDLEVFVLPGVNDTPARMRRIADLASTFAPDSVFLNTAVRPPADSTVKRAAPEVIKELSLLFGQAAAKPIVIPKASKCPYSDESIISATTRHPTSISQLVKQFDISRHDLIDKLQQMKNKGLIALRRRDSEIFVSPPEQS